MIERFPQWLLRGRLVGCGRGQTSSQIAEFVLAAMLLREKRLDEVRAHSPKNWVKSPIGTLEHKTLGILGFGAIGTEVARRATPFGINIVACRRGEWAEIPEGVTPLSDPAAVLSVSDHAVIALPLTGLTRGSIDGKVLRSAKPGLHLINVSRGAILKQEDLIEALDEGVVGFATLDVTDPEPLPEGHSLWSHGRVFLTPHISFMGGDPFGRFLEKTLSNLADYVDGRPLRDLVDVKRGY
jgi:phosphoglycerate dehydrogenase-like enzyme